MNIICAVTAVFALLTIYFCYEQYKKNCMDKKSFAVISAIEAVTAAVMAITALIL